jgi:transposase
MVVVQLWFGVNFLLGLLGCFSGTGVGPLVRIEGIMDAKLYKDILQRQMLRFAKNNSDEDWIFQHDNNPKHTSKLVSKFLDDKGVDVLTWPAQSPDLNPIEHLWEHVDRQIRSKAYTKTGDLFNGIVAAWDSIPDNVIQVLLILCLAVVMLLLRQKVMQRNTNLLCLFLKINSAGSCECPQTFFIGDFLWLFCYGWILGIMF